MSHFAENQWFTVHLCGKCGVAFAMTNEFINRRKEDRETWYCPNGHGRMFTGETEAQRLKRELDRQKEITENANARANSIQERLKSVKKSHIAMRKRVANGVCPCCNRTFQNLLNHMRSQHPDFGAGKTFAQVRQVFGMTQSQVADESGVNPAYVSLYERGKDIPDRSKRRLDEWLETQA